MSLRVSLLDVGQAEYGDALLLQFDDRSVLIDGAHPGDQSAKGVHVAFPDQLSVLLEQTNAPYSVNLLVVTHAHADHIGCLPFLIANNLVAADWALVADPGLGWGRLPAAAPDAAVDARVRQVITALREERPSPRTDDATLSTLIADAADLESRYVQMLSTLGSRGTQVVRYGLDDPVNLLQAFDDIGLSILGPSTGQLSACARLIATATQDLMQVGSNLFEQDDRATTLEAYRRLAWRTPTADEAVARPGSAINLQSLVTSFEFDGATVLTAGDMQWMDPDTAEPDIIEGLRSLREQIRAAAPYAFVKLSHHGSENACSPELLDDLAGTPVFGICAGERSTSHPNASVLDALNDRREELTWVRTDHNRGARVTFEASQIGIELDAGEVDDATPNTTDELTFAGMPLAPPRQYSRPLVRVARAAQGGEENVEVIVKVPNKLTQVDVSVSVNPRGANVLPSAVIEPEVDLGAIRIGGGRDLPDLLFVTNAVALARNIGAAEAEALIRTLREAASQLIDDVPCGPGSAAQALRTVRERLSTPGLRGVVILGGYDVAPGFVVDCLPPDLRRAIGSNSDADDFVVWSDDPYGDMDGDGLPELPVSRIPDGKSADLLLAAIQANDARLTNPRFGIRNKLRPFADEVFAALPAPGDLLVSAPATSTQPAFLLDADLTYIMLHGDFDDSTRFWGEEPPEYPVGVALPNVPAQSARVVLAGCCWGALIADKRASRADPTLDVGQKSAGTSIALAFLAAGALGYIGCTGSHYSPTDPPYRSAGGPMHAAFWQQVLAGKGPSEALFLAKAAYARDMPHGQTSTITQAIEFKILRIFTCLGLGW
jgi:beta-lactamase superfamily II metal-dependent hydrolase